MVVVVGDPVRLIIAVVKECLLCFPTPTMLKMDLQFSLNAYF